MNKNKKSGFSLVELLIALVIMGIVTAAGVQLLGTGSSLMARQASSGMRLNTERFTLEGIYNELRKGHISKIEIADTAPGWDGNNQDFKYIFLQEGDDGVSRAVVRKFEPDGGGFEAVDTPIIGAEDIESLVFKILTAKNPDPANYMLAIDVVAARVNHGEVPRRASREVGLFERTDKDGDNKEIINGVEAFTGSAIGFVAFKPANDGDGEDGEDEGGGEEEPYEPPVPPTEGVYHVVQGGTVSSDGSEWGAGDGNLQRAITAVTTRGGKDAGKQIWVKQGTYKLTAKLDLVAGTRMYGGLSGDEISNADRDARDLSEANLTVIDLNKNFIHPNANNCGGIVMDGFLIKNGGAEKGGALHLCNSAVKAPAVPTGTRVVNCIFSDNAEGGISLCDNVYLTVEKSVFKRNAKSAINTHKNPVYVTLNDCIFEANGFAPATPNTLTATGGAIFHAVGVLSADSCEFSGNKAVDGGAIYSTATTTVTNSILSGDTATTSGGGIYNGSTMTIKNSTLYGNKALSSSGNVLGGGIYNKGTIKLEDCTFQKNEASATASGKTASGGAIYTIADTTLHNSTLSGNLAKTLGGGIYTSAATTITNSTLAGNQATTTTSATTGIGGGLYVADGVSTVANCTFSGNVAALNGGGAYIVKNNPTFTNCTFSDNKANADKKDDDGGGGIYVLAGTTTIRNSILWGNAAVNNPTKKEIKKKAGTVTVLGSVLTSAANGGFLTAELTPSSSFFTTPGIVSMDRRKQPTTIPANVYIYTLPSSGSSALNNGISTGFTPLPPTNDQRGVARWDVPSVGTTLVDIGAYEYNANSMDHYPKSWDIYPF